MFEVINLPGIEIAVELDAIILQYLMQYSIPNKQTSKQTKYK